MSTAEPPAGPAAVAPPTDLDGPTSLTHRQILVIISGLMAGMLLAALDMTIVSTSIRTIADDLDGLSVQAWVTTAYLITSTIATPLYGKLSDQYGRRPFFLTAISIFIVGSLLSGAAQSMYELAAFRAIQGLGAGGLFSLALAIVGDIVSPRERAKYQGYFLAVFGSSSVLGPVVGGFFASADSIFGITGWRWVFLINLPIGLIALAVVARVLHVPHTSRPHRIDFPGAVAITVALVPLLIVAEQGREWGWISGGAIACYLIGLAGLAGFILAERAYGDEALLPLRLFTRTTFSIASLLNLIIGMGMFGGIAALPLYMQIVRGHTPTESGLLLLPLTAGLMSGSIISGQIISRTGRYKIFPVIGSMLLVVGMLLFTQFGVDTGMLQISLSSAVFGLGLGFNMQTLVLAIQNSVPPQDMGVATSSATFFRQMGGTLGTAVFLSVLFGSVFDKIREAAVAASAQTTALLQQNPALASDPANRPVIGILRAATSGATSGGSASLDDTSFLKAADQDLARPILTGFANSIDLVFLIGACVLALAFVIVLFLPEEKLRTESGLEARQSQERAERAQEAALAATAAESGAPVTPFNELPTAREGSESPASSPR